MSLDVEKFHLPNFRSLSFIKFSVHHNGLIYMRKFAFQELAYAIVVSSSYGLLLGLLYNEFSDIWIFLAWLIVICLHLAGIWFIEHLETRKTDKS